MKKEAIRRPPFIISARDVPEKAGSYPNSDEVLSHGRAIGRVAGLLRIGLHVERLEPGQRTSWPHAEENEEEFVYVLQGEVDAWIDGELHRMEVGDLAAFPAGTGISHTFLNNSGAEALLLVGGESGKCDSRIFYPLHPSREQDLPWSRWWRDVPRRPLGSHDGCPYKKSHRG
ncbi:MAG: cupin domain-containing protein [Deltaproteobacteria bacterium]|nr:cupin domain-containing protein [Deltaproteobacteria bacterium]